MMRLAVLGHPVSHSRSPVMQNAALAAAGLDGVTRFVDLIDGVPATSGNGVLTLDLPAYGVRWLRTEE